MLKTIDIDKEIEKCKLSNNYNGVNLLNFVKENNLQIYSKESVVEYRKTLKKYNYDNCNAAFYISLIGQMIVLSFFLYFVDKRENIVLYSPEFTFINIVIAIFFVLNMSLFWIVASLQRSRDMQDYHLGFFPVFIFKYRLSRRMAFIVNEIQKKKLNKNIIFLHCSCYPSIFVEKFLFVDGFCISFKKKKRPFPTHWFK